ncbi:hypothetical protein GCM10022255_056270 [Dactylosporangium darangshiense]|jgi:hypothetical protein|uniref:Uncharacterized protein n=1 Tax=Dactylosporangium darangshiense TaxID=579108 RepID=A0ABP8DEM4_9ACTN
MRDPREEAERLVAAALAAASMAARSTAGFATGSAECCVCPLCKAIAAARDPDPDFAERLATGAGDLAAGVASVLRAFGERVSDKAPDDDSSTWRSATRETSTTDSDVAEDDPDKA